MNLTADDAWQIHQLLARYGHAIDDRDWAAFRQLFVAEAVMDYTQVRAPGVLHGIEAILGYFHTANHPAAHHVSNIVITALEPGRAHVRSKWFAPFSRPSHQPKRWAGGNYVDILVRTDEELALCRQNLHRHVADDVPQSGETVEPRRHSF